MFTKILIANRGEIACRVIDTARKMGIKTVAVYSDADRNALHVKQADEAVHIGPAASQQSYLKAERIVQAAIKTGAQAIHPGYGFLSESSEFAQLCQEHKLVFIGPPTSAIEAMGSKSAAKRIMSDANVPLVPGYHGDDQSAEILKQSADEMGYPVLLKAVAGGGGKGMRQVWKAEEFDEALSLAKSEAKSSFDNDDMLVEKYLVEPRHVEIQVFCDQHKNAVYLSERDCSVQRRHQKVVEEAPAPNLSDELRIAMGEAAVQAALAIDYVGAGTVEFLLDKDGSFYFMEMNTRLQVEHPVTEMITGLDLVEWQLRVANGERLPLQQSQVKLHGHAFEARIYAEDPNNDFLPTAGKLSHLQTPKPSNHVRVDTGVLAGDEVSPFYDPMIAKLVVWDENRARALSRLSKALREYQITGVTTNIDFMYTLVNTDAFQKAELSTSFIEDHQQQLFATDQSNTDHLLVIAACYLQRLNEQQNNSDSPWKDQSGWRLNQANQRHYSLIVNEQQYQVEVCSNHAEADYLITAQSENYLVNAQLDNNKLIIEIDGHRQTVSLVDHTDSFTIFTEQGATAFKLAQPDYGEADNTSGAGGCTAPMNGTIIEILAKAGDTVESGSALVVMEAMKMQHTIVAPSDGVVKEIFCAVGDLVDGGSILVDFEKDQA